MVIVIGSILIIFLSRFFMANFAEYKEVKKIIDGEDKSNATRLSEMFFDDGNPFKKM